MRGHSILAPKRKPRFENDSRGTPPELYRALDEEFRFTIDPCPLDSSATAGAPLWGKDGLARSWKGERVFCNPPYSSAWSGLVARTGHRAESLEVMR